MNKFLPIFTLGVLAACSASTVHYFDPVAAQDSVKCTEDKFNNIVTCDMSEIIIDKDGNPITNTAYYKMPVTNMYLRVAFKPDTRAALIALNGNITSTDWKRPYKIIDDSGREISFDKVDSKASDCSSLRCVLREYISIDLDRNYIYSHASRGITLKIYGQRGNMVVSIPAAYVTGFNNFLASEGL